MILEKCADRSLISARSLCPVDDETNKSRIYCWEFFLTWSRNFLDADVKLKD